MHKKILVGTIIFYVLSGCSFSNENTNDFDSKLFQRVDIAKQAKSLSHNKKLTNSQKKTLLDIKENIVDFLRLLDSSEETALKYLAQDYKKQFKNVIELYQKYFDAESLLRYEIYNYKMLKQNNNKYIIFGELTETSEGVQSIRPLEIHVLIIKGKYQIYNIVY